MKAPKRRKRNVRIVFYLNEDELQLLEDKMEAANVRNREAYIRKMVLDGYIIRIDTEPVQRVSYLVSNMANNLNQIAKRANETRSVHSEDIHKLQAEFPALFSQIGEAMHKLTKL